MKKLAIFALVLGLAIAITVPALAFKIEGDKDQKFYFGGNVALDLGYWQRSKEFAPAWGGKDSRTELLLQTSQFSMIKASFESGNAGAYWEMGLGRDNIGWNEQNESANAADKLSRYSYIENRKIYGWYKFGNCKITAGKLDGSFLALAPSQMMGYIDGYLSLVGWGVLWDDRTTQVRYSQEISKAFSYQISLIQPTVYGDAGAGQGAIDSYANFPRVDARFDLNFGPVSLFPGGSYSIIKWDNMPAGWDDNLTIWYAQLPVQVKAGAFTGKFQIGYGQNIQGFQAESGYQKYVRLTDGSIKNTKGITGFFDLSFASGPVTPHLYFGYDRAENTDAWKVGDDNSTRMAYGANIWWMVSPNFFVIPEFTYYDYGKKPNTVGSPDIGNQWIGGVQFFFTF